MEPRAATRGPAHASLRPRRPAARSWRLGPVGVFVMACIGCGAPLGATPPASPALAARPAVPIAATVSRPASNAEVGATGRTSQAPAVAVPGDVAGAGDLPATVGGEDGDAAAEARHEAIEIDDLAIDPSALEDDLRGFRVGFRYRWTTGDPAALATVNIRFATTGGRPIRAAVDEMEYRDHGGRLRAQTEVTGNVSRWIANEVFIPFYVVDLPAGQHQVTALIEIEAESGTGQGREPTVVRSGGDAVAVIDKPPVTMVRVLVPRIEVSRGVYDPVILRPHKAAPELTWSLRLGRGAGHVVHQARFHWDTYEAEWDQPTPPFPWSEGDGMTVSVIDVDTLLSDVLGTFSFSYEDLCRRAAERVPLSRGRVSHLSLQVRIVAPDRR